LTEKRNFFILTLCKRLLTQAVVARGMGEEAISRDCFAKAHHETLYISVLKSFTLTGMEVI